MKQYIGCDAHTRYSVFVSVDETGKVGKPVRFDHGGRDLRDYLAQLGQGTSVAVEASGGWYWFIMMERPNRQIDGVWQSEGPVPTSGTVGAGRRFSPG